MGPLPDDAFLGYFLALSAHRVVYEDLVSHHSSTIDYALWTMDATGVTTHLGSTIDPEQNNWVGGGFPSPHGDVSGAAWGEEDSQTLVGASSFGVYEIDLATGLHTLLLPMPTKFDTEMPDGTVASHTPLREGISPGLFQGPGGTVEVNSGNAIQRLDLEAHTAEDVVGVHKVYADELDDVSPLAGTPLLLELGVARSGGRYFAAAGDVVMLGDTDAGTLSRYVGSRDQDRLDDCALAGATGGDLTPCALGDGGPAVDATIMGGRIAACPDGSLYLAEAYEGCVRRVSPDGIIDTVAFECANLSGTGEPVAGPALDQVVNRNFAPSFVGCAPEGDRLFLTNGFGDVWELGLPAPGRVTGR